MLLGISEATFDHRATKPRDGFRLRGAHVRLVGLQQLFPFVPFDRSAFLGIADATFVLRTDATVLRGTVKPMSDHGLSVAPRHSLLPLVIQSMPFRTSIRALVGKPLKLLFTNVRLHLFGSFLLGEVVLLMRTDQLDAARLALLEVEQRHVAGIGADLSNHDARDYLCAVDQRSLRRSAPSDSIVRKLYALIARCHEMVDVLPAALGACAEGLRIDPDDAELHFRKAVLHRKAGQPAQAEACWRRILSLKCPDRFCSVDQGINGHLTWRNLAKLAEERGDRGEALRLWKLVPEACPGDAEARARCGAAP